MKHCKKVLLGVLALLAAVTVSGKPVDVPFKKFNAASGSFRAELTLADKNPVQQEIVNIYSSKGDVFNLLYRKNRLQAAYYDRSEKKWYNMQGVRPLVTGKKAQVLLSWNFPGRIELMIDGKSAGTMDVPVKPQFAPDTKITLDGDYRGKGGFSGRIEKAEFFSGRKAAERKGGKSVASAKKTTAEYIFELTIDEPLKDLSGNNNHPLETPGESRFVKGEMDSIRFAQDGDGVRLPAAAFPGACGAVEAVLKLENKPAQTSYIFSYYSGKGDVFNMIYRKNRLQVNYYDRSEKKWYNTVDPRPLPPGKFVKVTATWQLPGEVKIFINDKAAGSFSVPVKTAFHAQSLFTLGGGHQKDAVFPGMIHSIRFFNVPEIPAGKKGERAANPVFQVKSGNMQLAFDSKKLNLQSWVCSGVEYITAGNNVSIWQMRVRDNESGKFTDISADDAGRTSYRTGQEGAILVWHDIPLPDGSKTEVAAEVKFAGKDELVWKIKTALLPEKFGVDNMRYPRIACAPTAKDKRQMYICYPKYYGINIPDAFSFKSGRGRAYGSSYPGGAHWQFAYLYGKNVPGIYFHADDISGGYKEFHFKSEPQDNIFIMFLSQTPEQRGVSRKFVSTYPVRTAIIRGDWYDAAARYRAWAEKQPWCAAGTLDKRSDLPEWILNSHIATRHSTMSANHADVKRAMQRVAINIDNVRTVARELNCTGMGVWYSYGVVPPGTRSTFYGAGQFNARPEVKTVPGVPEAVAEFRKNNIYTLGYLNTRIYDNSPDPDHADTKAVEPLVMRYQDGSYQLYGNKSFDVCRIARPWQERLLAIIKRDAVENGFSGMYLDSFGRGQTHCWAANHGHAPGCTTSSVSGQRELAKLIRGEMRKIIPGFVISSEASIEQFVDLIDVKLHHENIYAHAVPVWTKIYHDRQLLYGRNTNYPRIQITSCFHIGAMLGRIFMGDSDEKLRRVYLTDEILPYYRKLIAVRKRFQPQIAIGEMLRPPQIRNVLPPTREKIEKADIVYPAVTASAWRSADGVKCAVFTNHTAQSAEFSFSLDKKELGEPKNWLIADGEGNLHKQPYSGVDFTLEPLGVAVLEF